MTKRLPKEILVYKFDEDEHGEPMYSIAMNVDEIPEDADGQKIGVYVLDRHNTFRVRRELK